jgi:DNA polymerase III sliding clamp (beta) subunit (PCNA family)
VGEAVESVDLAGGTLSATIGVNGNYVADFLAVAGSEEVKISYRDASSQLLFEPAGENSGRFRHVVMPLRQAT